MIRSINSSNGTDILVSIDDVLEHIPDEDLRDMFNGIPESEVEVKGYLEHVTVAHLIFKWVNVNGYDLDGDFFKGSHKYFNVFTVLIMIQKSKPNNGGI